MATFYIALNDGKGGFTREAAKAWANAGGLAVHGTRKSGYTISHSESGFALPRAHFAQRKDALDAYKALLNLNVDWTMPREDLERCGKALVNRVREIMHANNGY